MKLICLSDIHGTSRIPRGRLGNPLDDFTSKLKFIFKLSKKLNDAPIIASGDLFDSPRDIIALFKFLSVTVKYPNTSFFTVYGQHDMYFRNKKVVTNLGILERSGVITILNKKPYKLREKIKENNLYGCGWKDKVPKIKDGTAFNILSIHAPIYSEPIFPGQILQKPNSWMKKNKGWDLVVSADIHRSFIKTTSSGIILNTGPIMRLETSKYCMKHKPHLIVFDTETKEAERIFIPCKSSEEVLNRSVTIKNKEVNSIENIFGNSDEVQEVKIYDVIEKLLRNSKNSKGIREVLCSLSNEFKQGERHG